MYEVKFEEIVIFIIMISFAFIQLIVASIVKKGLLMDCNFTLRKH